MGPITAALLAILITIIGYCIFYAWKINQYWKERNIPHAKPWLFIGNSAPSLLNKLSATEIYNNIFKQFPNETMLGFYDMLKPSLLIRDVDIIEKILIKDFMHFTDRGFEVDEEINPLDSNLFTMNGKRWKAVRNRLSPIFTTGKLKLMYESMTACGDQLVNLIEENEEIEMREILGRFAMDVIGSCAFGIEVGNLANPNSKFHEMGKKVFQPGGLQFIKLLLVINFPILGKIFNASFAKKDAMLYYRQIIDDTIKYRRENNYQRNDFLQLLMQLQEKGYVEMHTKDEADDYLKIDTTYSTEKFELTNEQLTGQAFIFLTAGFDAITLTLTFALYELSKHPSTEEKVRNEIQREVKNAGGSLTYDAVKEMNYLEQCLKETMRLHSPVQMLFRVCKKTYTFPSGLIFNKGMQVIIPIDTVHHDPTYFPEPDQFKPERFDPDQTIPSCAYIPFGNGPRICIAMRFAMLEMKYCLAKLLMNYSFKVSPKTKEPFTYNPRSIFTSPMEPILFNITKISS